MRLSFFQKHTFLNVVHEALFINLICIYTWLLSIVQYNQYCTIRIFLTDLFQWIDISFLDYQIPIAFGQLIK